MNNYNNYGGYNNYNNYSNYGNYNNYGYNNYNYGYDSGALYNMQNQGLTIPKENKLLSHTYAWMAGGLGISSIIAFIVMATPIWKIPGVSLVALILLVINVGLSYFIRKKSISSPKTAGTLFLVFTALEGPSLGIICAGYGPMLVAEALLLTCIDFGTMSLIGLFTKANLKPLYKQLMGALVALVVVGLVGIVIGVFTGNVLFWLVFSCIDCIVFSLITICDTKRLIRIAKANINQPGIAVIGAFELYLDFINIFLDILEILGSSNRNN